MTIPFSFPDWVPWWAQLLLLVAAILMCLAFVLMPFSVFGLKSRLEAMEARLDEIQGEIRSLALRLPEPGRGSAYDDVPVPRAVPEQTLAARPPIPPAAWRPDSEGRRPIGSQTAPAERAPRVEPRAEPRLGPRR